MDRTAHKPRSSQDRHSNVTRRQPQDRGQGACGHDDARHHNVNLPAFDGLAGVQGEPVAAFPDFLDISKPTNENILNLMRVYQPQGLFQIDLHYDALPTRARRDAHSPSYDAAITFTAFHMWDRAHAYQVVNGGEAA